MPVKIEISTSGEFKDTIRWLSQLEKKIPEKTLKQLGNQRVSALAAATPRDTGETAKGWSFDTARITEGAELIFYNSAHPELYVNIALLIQMGHGTGTGGYVPPVDYINPALKSLFATAGDYIAKEMFE